MNGDAVVHYVCHPKDEKNKFVGTRVRIVIDGFITEMKQNAIGDTVMRVDGDITKMETVKVTY